MIRDGEFTLADSTAICLYLEKKYPSSLVLPDGAEAYGRALWFDAYAGGTLFRQVVHPLFHQRVVAPNINKVATDQSAVDRVLNEVRPKIFGYLELEIDGKFLCRTVADAGRYRGGFEFPDLSVLRISTIEADRYPKLVRYLGEIFGVDVFRRALEGEKPFVEQMGLSRGFLK